VLHVTNGDSAVARLRAAGIRGDVLPWRDALHEGPVPAGPDDDELRAVRARFIAAQGWADEDRVRTDMAERDARLAEALESGEELVLWFETDLYDMLQLAQVLDRLHRAAGAGAASLAIAGEDAFVGVAQLTNDELRALHADGERTRRARRIPVDAALTEAGRAVWAALRSPDPRVLQPLATGGTPALPAFGEAVRRHLQQFPWRGSNVNRTERALLEAVGAGARTREAAFVAQQAREERPFLGDALAFDHLDALARGPGALIGEGDGDRSLAASGTAAALEGEHDGRLALTAHGEAVLAGHAAWAGRPERWLGGVRLAAGEPRWCWDPATGRLA
jgi:hypothetical protein